MISDGSFWREIPYYWSCLKGISKDVYVTFEWSVMVFASQYEEGNLLFVFYDGIVLSLHFICLFYDNIKTEGGDCKIKVMNENFQVCS
jgi:hypothetical protein